MTNEPFAPRLEFVLKAVSMSRGQLASEVGVDKSVVSRWFSAGNLPSSHNLARITAAIAARRDGFSMLDWDCDLAGLAAKFAAAPTLAVSTPDTGAATLGDWMPERVRKDAFWTTAARGDAYEGFWRSTRPSNEFPGRFTHDHIMIRKGPDGLLRTRMGVVDMRFEGVLLPTQTQLFSMAVDAATGVFLFTIFNAVLRHRAEVMDGLTLTLTRNGGGAAVAGRALMERTGLLSGDLDGDDARFEASIRENPMAAEGSIPENIRAHLLRDVGPSALRAGGEVLLTMAFAESLSRGPVSGLAAPE
jgi:hypothetical protein